MPAFGNYFLLFSIHLIYYSYINPTHAFLPTSNNLNLNNRYHNQHNHAFPPRRTTTRGTTANDASYTKKTRLLQKSKPSLSPSSSSSSALKMAKRFYDMIYTKDNIKRQYRHYLNIKKASEGGGDKDATNDVYVRDPKRNEWWYIGKLARCTGTVTLSQAINRQRDLIQEHAGHLRPVELSRRRDVLEVWVAPCNSELQIAENDPRVPLIKVDRCHDDDDDDDVSKVNLLEVGLYCEIVTNRGEGFRVERRDDGSCL